MKAPKNRRVFVIGYGAATPLGATFEKSWARAVKGEAGFRKVTRCEVHTACNVVGEIPDWDPRALDFTDEKEIYNWNADFVLLTMAVCQEAVRRAGLVDRQDHGPRTACLIGSALNGSDAYRKAMDNYLSRGPLKVSPYLLPNLCANLPSGKAGMLLGFTGPIFSPEGACASGNHAIGIGARMIRDGDVDFVLAGGVDTCIIPEIIHGFENMNATIKIKPGDRAHDDPAQASRPFSADRKGFVLSEGAGVVVLAADEMVRAHGLEPKAEVLGVGWNSDAHHITRPNNETIIVCMKQAIEDAGLARRHTVRERPRHLHAQGRRDRDRMPEGGIRSWNATSARIIEQVADRPHPGRRGRDRGGLRHRGDAAGHHPPHGEPYPGPAPERRGRGPQRGPQAEP